MAVSYWQKLKDPRWQKRRLEILSKAEFRCQLCMDDEQTLHVHHLIYDKGKDPWDYEDYWLACLCESCHEEWHEASRLLSAAVAGLNPYDIRRVAGYAFGIGGTSFELGDKGRHCFCPNIEATEMGQGLYDAVRDWLPADPSLPATPECQLSRLINERGLIEKSAIWTAFHEVLAERRRLRESAKN